MCYDCLADMPKPACLLDCKARSNPQVAPQLAYAPLCFSAEQWADALLEWLGLTEERMHIVTRNADADLAGRRFDCLIASYNYLGQLADKWDPCPDASFLCQLSQQYCVFGRFARAQSMAGACAPAHGAGLSFCAPPRCGHAMGHQHA